MIGRSLPDATSPRREHGDFRTPQGEPVARARADRDSGASPGQEGRHGRSARVKGRVIPGGSATWGDGVTATRVATPTAATAALRPWLRRAAHVTCAAILSPSREAAGGGERTVSRPFVVRRASETLRTTGVAPHFPSLSLSLSFTLPAHTHAHPNPSSRCLDSRIPWRSPRIS